ncbi:phosphatase PAP2 family protein [Streptomyces sp. CA-179760]|uniref:phosphatase PAP2 family protein n=1 Tax=Streptomyces sp. CA-179760 TaxID=3240054 RepID=UPI003D8C4FBA
MGARRPDRAVRGGNGTRNAGGTAHAAAGRRLSPDPGYSFPSGHVASATLVLMVLLAVLRSGTRVWWSCLVLGSALVGAVGVSRVLADAHHAADVAGGVLLGLVVGFAVAWRVDVRSPHLSRKET